ncbi:MAG: beta-lactamase family protein [Proteobacteria bacterium]|nr:beta-lactamase family protein [Pseudomonadota bacterium]MBU1719237.1 beta-lactamase family protein [Bacteroidota bacterium]
MKIFNSSCSKKISCIIIFSIFSFLAENAVCEQPKKREYWPTSGWKTSTPEQQGMDSAKLMIADEFIQNRLPDAFSLLVVKNGYLVFEKYYSWGSPYKYAAVHSVTKSVISALIGIALDKGYLKSVDQKLIEFFPEYITDDLDPRSKEISLKHLLTMSSGFRWDDRGSNMWAWSSSSDWFKSAIQLPQENNPGEVFNYNSATSHLLSGILSRATETSTLDFAKRNLFEPLGVQSAYWHQDPQGYYIGGFGLGLSARDLAKIGFLYLNNGYWNGQSIVSEYWVKESTDQQIQAFSHPIYGTFGYGYQWWVKKIDGCSSFRAWGRRGQFIVIVPELDLVIVVTSNVRLPHPPTSIHYSPLFDLVAASVQRKRPTKEPLKAVALPADIKAFITDYNQARINKDLATMADSISDRFLHHGVTKQMALSFLSETSSYISDAKIIITKFEPEDDEAIIDAWLKDKYFEAPFMTGSKLIKENGNWKWYGNQAPK